MPRQNYKRTIDQLKEVASFFWPEEISQKAAELSVIPRLIETQDSFLSILGVPITGLENLFTILGASDLPANLFLKHLVVLADFGGEMLQRINSQFHDLYPEGTLEFLRDDQKHSYEFKQLPVTNLNNEKLGISGKRLFEKHELSDLHKDVAALLIFGSSCTEEKTSNILAKCEIGEYLGDKEKLEKFVKQRYIWVSRITGGSQANNLGQIAQKYVNEYISENLGLDNMKIKSGTIPEITHTEGATLTNFDIVVTDERKYVAIEVSFQVTTNSTIERKAGQSKSRYDQLEKAGHKIVYVIDGAGNFQRQNAISTLCTYSHCTVAFSNAELDFLCAFLREYFAEPNK